MPGSFARQTPPSGPCSASRRGRSMRTRPPAGMSFLTSSRGHAFGRRGLDGTPLPSPLGSYNFLPAACGGSKSLPAGQNPLSPTFSLEKTGRELVCSVPKVSRLCLSGCACCWISGMSTRVARCSRRSRPQRRSAGGRSRLSSAKKDVTFDSACTFSNSALTTKLYMDATGLRIS